MAHKESQKCKFQTIGKSKISLAHKLFILRYGLPVRTHMQLTGGPTF
jgi:hypothetical protein